MGLAEAIIDGETAFLDRQLGNPRCVSDMEKCERKLNYIPQVLRETEGFTT